MKPSVPIGTVLAESSPPDEVIMTDARIQSFEEFWPFYVGEHRSPVNRGLHYLGTMGALAILVVGVTVGPLWLLWLIGVAG